MPATPMPDLQQVDALLDGLLRAVNAPAVPSKGNPTVGAPSVLTSTPYTNSLIGGVGALLPASAPWRFDGLSPTTAPPPFAPRLPPQPPAFPSSSTLGQYPTAPAEWTGGFRAAPPSVPSLTPPQPPNFASPAPFPAPRAGIPFPTAPNAQRPVPDACGYLYGAHDVGPVPDTSCSSLAAPTPSPQPPQPAFNVERPMVRSAYWPPAAPPAPSDPSWPRLPPPAAAPPSTALARTAPLPAPWPAGPEAADAYGDPPPAAVPERPARPPTRLVAPERDRDAVTLPATLFRRLMDRLEEPRSAASIAMPEFHQERTCCNPCPPAPPPWMAYPPLPFYPPYPPPYPAAEPLQQELRSVQRLTEQLTSQVEALQRQQQQQQQQRAEELAGLQSAWGSSVERAPPQPTSGHLSAWEAEPVVPAMTHSPGRLPQYMVVHGPGGFNEERPRAASEPWRPPPLDTPGGYQPPPRSLFPAAEPAIAPPAPPPARMRDACSEHLMHALNGLRHRIDTSTAAAWDPNASPLPGQRPFHAHSASTEPLLGLAKRLGEAKAGPTPQPASLSAFDNPFSALLQRLDEKRQDADREQFKLELLARSPPPAASLIPLPSAAGYRDHLDVSLPPANPLGLAPRATSPISSPWRSLTDLLVPPEKISGPPNLSSPPPGPTRPDPTHLPPSLGGPSSSLAQLRDRLTEARPASPPPAEVRAAAAAAASAAPAGPRGRLSVSALRDLVLKDADPEPFYTAVHLNSTVASSYLFPPTAESGPLRPHLPWFTLGSLSSCRSSPTASLPPVASPTSPRLSFISSPPVVTTTSSLTLDPLSSLTPTDRRPSGPATSATRSTLTAADVDAHVRELARAMAAEMHQQFLEEQRRVRAPSASEGLDGPRWTSAAPRPASPPFDPPTPRALHPSFTAALSPPAPAPRHPSRYSPGPAFSPFAAVPGTAMAHPTAAETTATDVPAAAASAWTEPPPRHPHASTADQCPSSTAALNSKSFPGLDATPPLPAAAPPPAVRPRADTAELLTPILRHARELAADPSPPGPTPPTGPAPGPDPGPSADPSPMAKLQALRERLTGEPHPPPETVVFTAALQQQLHTATATTTHLSFNFPPGVTGGLTAEEPPPIDIDEAPGVSGKVFTTLQVDLKRYVADPSDGGAQWPPAAVSPPPMPLPAPAASPFLPASMQGAAPPGSSLTAAPTRSPSVAHPAFLSPAPAPPTASPPVPTPAVLAQPTSPVPPLSGAADAHPAPEHRPPQFWDPAATGDLRQSGVAAPTVPFPDVVHFVPGRRVSAETPAKPLHSVGRGVVLREDAPRAGLGEGADPSCLSALQVPEGGLPSATAECPVAAAVGQSPPVPLPPPLNAPTTVTGVSDEVAVKAEADRDAHAKPPLGDSLHSGLAVCPAAGDTVNAPPETTTSEAAVTSLPGCTIPSRPLADSDEDSDAPVPAQPGAVVPASPAPAPASDDDEFDYDLPGPPAPPAPPTLLPAATAGTAAPLGEAISPRRLSGAAEGVGFTGMEAAAQPAMEEQRHGVGGGGGLPVAADHTPRVEGGQQTTPEAQLAGESAVAATTAVPAANAMLSAAVTQAEVARVAGEASDEVGEEVGAAADGAETSVESEVYAEDDFDSDVEVATAISAPPAPPVAVTVSAPDPVVALSADVPRVSPIDVRGTSDILWETSAGSTDADDASGLPGATLPLHPSEPDPGALAAGVSNAPAPTVGHGADPPGNNAGDETPERVAREAEERGNSNAAEAAGEAEDPANKEEVHEELYAADDFDAAACSDAPHDRPDPGEPTGRRGSALQEEAPNPSMSSPADLAAAADEEQIKAPAPATEVAAPVSPSAADAPPPGPQLQPRPMVDVESPPGEEDEEGEGAYAEDDFDGESDTHGPATPPGAPDGAPVACRRNSADSWDSGASGQVSQAARGQPGDSSTASEHPPDLAAAVPNPDSVPARKSSMAQLATGSKPEEDSPQVGDEGEEVEEEPQYAEEFDTEPEEAEGAGDQQRVEGAREEEGVPTVAPPSDDEADRQDPDAGPPQLCGEKPDLPAEDRDAGGTAGHPPPGSELRREISASTGDGCSGVPSTPGQREAMDVELAEEAQYDEDDFDEASREGSTVQGPHSAEQGRPYTPPDSTPPPTTATATVSDAVPDALSRNADEAAPVEHHPPADLGASDPVAGEGEAEAAVVAHGRRAGAASVPSWLSADTLTADDPVGGTHVAESRTTRSEGSDSPTPRQPSRHSFEADPDLARPVPTTAAAAPKPKPFGRRAAAAATKAFADFEDSDPDDVPSQHLTPATLMAVPSPSGVPSDTTSIARRDSFQSDTSNTPSAPPDPGPMAKADAAAEDEEPVYSEDGFEADHVASQSEASHVSQPREAALPAEKGSSEEPGGGDKPYHEDFDDWDSDEGGSPCKPAPPAAPAPVVVAAPEARTPGRGRSAAETSWDSDSTASGQQPASDTEVSPSASLFPPAGRAAKPQAGRTAAGAVAKALAADDDDDFDF